MDSLKQHNDGYRYMLVCIDVLSRLIYVAEAESKKSEHMIEAFEKVFKKAGVLPNKMYSDSGLEFQAKRMNEYWRSKDIIKHVMYSPHLHAGVVERANLNRTTGMRPVDVNFRNAAELRNRLYKDVEEHERKPKFKIELDSNWSVALSSIIYPNSFPSVGVDEDDFVNIKLLNPDYKSAGTDPTTVTLKVKIPSIQFHSIEHMKKSLNTIIQSAYDAKFPKESRVKRGVIADKELEKEMQPQPDKELTREVPQSITQDAELTRETSSAAPPDIELQRETEPKTSDKELGRESRPPQLSDKQLDELEHEKPKKEQFRPPPIVEHSKTSTIEQERLDLAKRVTEQSWKDTDSSAATAADIAEKAKTALNRAEQARRQAPNAPHAKKLFDNLSNMENNLRKLVEKISHESKKAAEAKRKLSVHYESKNLNECRKQADMAKKALKDTKKYLAELTPMYFSIAPEDKLGVNELANRVVTAVDDFLNAKVKAPRAPEDPKFPAGQPKQHQEKQLEKMKPTVEKELESRTKPLVSKISDKKELKREPEKATVEKELEREPIKAPEKELERESPKKADKELEPLITERLKQDDNLLEKAKNEIDEKMQEAIQTDSYIQKGLEKEIPEEPQKELERERNQQEKTETEFPSFEYEIGDSSEKQREPLEEQVDESYLSKKKEEKLDEEKIQIAENIAHEFPSTDYGTEDSENEKTEKWSPEQTKQKVMKGKEDSLEQPARQKNEEATLVKSTDKKEEEEFPSTEYEIEEDNNVLSLSSSSSIVAENKPSETAKTDEGSSLMPQIEEIAETVDDGQKSGTMLPVDFPSYNDEDNMNNVVLMNELPEETLISATPEDELNKSEHNDEDDLPDLPSPQALSTAKQRGEKKEATVVSERKKMLIGHQKQQRKAVEFLFNEITQRFYISIGSGVQHVDASSHLAYVLGFENTRLYYNHPAKYLPDLSGGVRQLYVYAPKLVEDTIIGDRMAPLLRVVNVSGVAPLDVPEVIYTNEFFKPIQNKPTQQEGKGEQQYFVGTRYQRGGGLLQNVARFLMPVASNLLSSASKEGIAAGTRVLGDLSQGKALKESLETHAKQGFENLAGKLHQCGKGGIYGRDNGRGRRVSKVKKPSDTSSSDHSIDRIGTIRRRRNKIIDQLSFP
ncbi:hypothetical protein niasHT_024926 [Heterodera trifolii]|uniref:Integrase catalytic domain-containing protein n=1 Tax=Heterodera trifolii TaxID=157864 RepID=A0ABD2KQP5_9BILA